MVKASFAPEFLNLTVERRVTIPNPYRAKISWMTGEGKKQAWLLLIVPGRFRLLSDAEVEQDPDLSVIRSVIVDGPSDTLAAATVFEPNEKAAMIGRLTPATLSPGSSWRLILPERIVPPNQIGQECVLLFSLGYLELWFKDAYQAALTCPLDSAI